MRILITGHEGFVGSHAYKSLRQSHQVLCLDRADTFKEWIDMMHYKTSYAFDYDVVIHAGAISDNQYKDADIFLWNALATKMLAERVRHLDGTMPYFIYLSSSIVRATETNLADRTFYGWTKYMGEDYVKQVYKDNGSDDYCILCPSVIWGYEDGYLKSSTSIPFRLATHTLEYLIKDYSRDYIHVDDAVNAIHHCIANRVRGKYDVRSGITTSNKEIADYSSWKGYQMIDDPLQMGYNQITRHVKFGNEILPGWEPTMKLSSGIRELERKYHQEEY